jgi:hypothetical protein
MDTDKGIIDLMVQGGEQICDHALAQWYSNKYQTDEKTKQQSIQEWNAKRRRIRELAKKIKALHSEAKR